MPTATPKDNELQNDDIAILTVNVVLVGLLVAGVAWYVVFHSAAASATTSTAAAVGHGDVALNKV